MAKSRPMTGASKPKTYSASCGKCTEIFTRSTEAAAVEARDHHADRCQSDWIDDYEPNR